MLEIGPRLGLVALLIAPTQPHPPVGADETLNQPGPARAKLAPVQARIVRFQAVNSGLVAAFASPDQPC
jgi:hypothetical protein